MSFDSRKLALYYNQCSMYFEIEEVFNNDTAVLSEYFFNDRDSSDEHIRFIDLLVNLCSSSVTNAKILH